jgi:hypothetical protein
MKCHQTRNYTNTSQHLKAVSSWICPVNEWSNNFTHVGELAVENKNYEFFLFWVGLVLFLFYPPKLHATSTLVNEIWI